MKFFALFLLIAAARAQTAADPAQFFAQVVRHHGGTPQNPIRDFVCQGSMVTQRHVLTVASFVRLHAREELRVYLQTTRFLNSTDVREVEHIDLYPDFNANAPDVHNIAILRVPYSDLDTVDVVPRNLGALTAVQCTIHAVVGFGESITQTTATIATTGCRANNPFCSTFAVAGSRCDGFVGASVICANQAYVAGIANAEVVCTMNPETGWTATGTFLSIEPYADWIRYVSSAKVIAAQMSLIMVTLAIGKFLL